MYNIYIYLYIDIMYIYIYDSIYIKHIIYTIHSDIAASRLTIHSATSQDVAAHYTLRDITGRCPISLPSMKATRDKLSQFLKVSHTSGCCS